MNTTIRGTRRHLALFFAMGILALPPSVGIAGDIDSVRLYRRKSEHLILQEFINLLSIPNVAADHLSIRRNAEHIVGMMRQRGLNPRLLEGVDTNAPPSVYGEWKVPGARLTIVLYAHYDGQPADPLKWQGSRPWQPVLRSAAIEAGGKLLPLPSANKLLNPDWRLYARSASDDKAGIEAILTAVDALRSSRTDPTVNLKFFFEGEEEAGSPHFAEIIRRRKLLLNSDVWIICDGPVHQSGRKQVVFGARGDANVDITVYGAKRPLHSGHYGNWAPNPAMILARLLASMKDESGHVAVPGWYDDVEPLGRDELRAIAEAPIYDSELRSQLGLARSEGGGKSLLELINLPSLNIDGLASADTGPNSRNVVPATATAALDLRLVKGNDYRRQILRLVEHVRSQGFYVIEREPTDDERLNYPLIAKVTRRPGGYNAERAPMDSSIALSVIDAVQSTSTRTIVKVPTLGASLPLSLLRNVLNATAIIVPIANYDNSQHAENENIRLQNLWDGIETMAAVMLIKPHAK